jgi:hypothetical protein
MSDIQDISAFDLDAVTGGAGYSAPVANFINCHNGAVETFNSSKRQYDNSAAWWDNSTPAYDNFGTTMQENIQKCITRYPLSRDPGGGF